MCGIAGIVGENANELIWSMLEVQKHRGPDFSGIWGEPGIILGHNRLSIIDLSSDANQPMLSECGRYVIVFNGEIYNYKELKEVLKDYPFKTESDTEVLLAAYVTWGNAMLSRLNGMFAFAIWDREKHLLFAARDRFGVKPFYYTFQNNAFHFASEIKALWVAGEEKVPDEKVWSSYFVYGSYGNPAESFWKGIRQLPAGHYLKYENGKLIIKYWYNFKERIDILETLSFDEVKSRYENLLHDSINLRFRSDVSVGFNISGGLDSSVLLALVNLRPDSRKIEAFTFYTGHSAYDELPWVEKMIKQTANPLNKVKLNVEETLEKIEEMAYYQDEPYGGLPTVAYGKIFEVAREKGIIVLLDGQGMDEQWAGYDYYVKKNNEIIQGISRSPFRPEVLKPEFRELAVKIQKPDIFEDELQNLQFRDLFYTKIPRALRFNDRASMKASTELREPFLDYRLVELAFAQPQEFKIRDGVRKFLLRELVKKYLHGEIVFAPKRPLQTPQREWLANELKEFVEEKIQELIENKSEWFDKDTVWKDWKKYLAGERDSSFHIWQWVNGGMLLK